MPLDDQFIDLELLVIDVIQAKVPALYRTHCANERDYRESMDNRITSLILFIVYCYIIVL